MVMAHRFFKHRGGAVSYIMGDESLLWEMAQCWEKLSALIEFPEMAEPLTGDLYLEVLKAQGKA